MKASGKISRTYLRLVGERHQSSFIFPPRCIAKKATEYSTVNTVPSELFIVTDSIRRVLVTSMVPLS